MVFTLTEKLAEEILRALENQEAAFVVRAEIPELIPLTPEVSVDEDSFYALPEWSSSHGFELREDFVSTLHSPIAKDELQRILHSGRGVFKSFKNKLKEYPEVEKLWHSFKNKRMHSYINDWYNQLREVWGLEKLEQEPEDNENLLEEDFQFSEYSSKDYKELTSYFNNAASGTSESSIDEQLGNAILELWLQNFESGETKNQSGLICRTPDEEFAGCITSAPISKRTDNIVVLTSFYVQEKFRGLGIGAELLSKHKNVLRDQKKEWILLTSIVPDSMESTLLSLGFKRTGSCFSAKIQN